VEKISVAQAKTQSPKIGCWLWN